MLLPPGSVGECIMFLGCPVRTFTHSSGHILLPLYLMNGLNSFNKSDRDYSLAPIDDLIRFWRSKVIGQGHIFVQVCGGIGIF